MIGILWGEFVRLFDHAIEHFVDFVIPFCQVEVFGLTEIPKIF